MKTSSPIIHPAFKLNGLQYESAEEILNFADGLVNQGDVHEINMAKFLEDWLNFQDTITTRTSGSTGKAKKIELSKDAMIASANATGAYFKLGPGTRALLCLSSEYIAGKMMLVRAMVLGWDLHVVAPEKGALTEYDNAYDFVAMVPYQVRHSLGAMNKIKKLIIGGGPIPKDLEAALQTINTEVFATYGMTETSTHIAARRVNSGAATDVFSALPGVKFEIDDRECLVISAPGIIENPLITNDLVDLISPTSFRWLGRYDFMINSGGVKLHPEAIEEKMAGTLKLPFIITSEEDRELGERVILVVEKDEFQAAPDYHSAFAKLSSYERPKKIYNISKFPYTETGKIKRADVVKVLKKYR